MEIGERGEPGRVVLAVSGELDIATVGDLRTRIDHAFLSAASEVVVDAGEVEFVDSSGLNVLIAARHRAQRLGVDFRLCNLPSTVRRRIETAGLQDYFALR